MVCIGVIGAMEEEVSSLINQMEDAESKTMAGMTFYKGTLWNQDTVVVQSGIGKVNMAICTQILVNIYGVDMLINTGVALSPSVPLSTIEYYLPLLDKVTIMIVDPGIAGQPVDE